MQANMTCIPPTSTEAYIAGRLQETLELGVFLILPLVPEYLIMVAEKYQKLEWYKFGPEKRQRLVRALNESAFLRFCEKVVPHAAFIKQSIFIVKIVDSFTLSIAEIVLKYFGVERWAAFCKKTLRCSDLSTLTTLVVFYTFFDLICMFFRFQYIKKFPADVENLLTNDEQINMQKVNLQRLGYTSVTQNSMQGPQGNIMTHRRHSF